METILYFVYLSGINYLGFVLTLPFLHPPPFSPFLLPFLEFSCSRFQGIITIYSLCLWVLIIHTDFDTRRLALVGNYWFWYLKTVNLRFCFCNSSRKLCRCVNSISGGLKGGIGEKSYCAWCKYGDWVITIM